jgi:hypothetical protein
MESYAIITEDRIFGDDPNIDTREGLAIVGDPTDRHPDEEKFYLIDDDGIVYYVGRLWQAEDDEESPWTAAYNFGYYDAGTICVSTSSSMKDSVI